MPIGSIFFVTFFNCFAADQNSIEDFRKSLLFNFGPTQNEFVFEGKIYSKKNPAMSAQECLANLDTSAEVMFAYPHFKDEVSRMFPGRYSFQVMNNDQAGSVRTFVGTLYDKPEKNFVLGKTQEFGNLELEKIESLPDYKDRERIVLGTFLARLHEKQLPSDFDKYPQVIYTHSQLTGCEYPIEYATLSDNYSTLFVGEKENLEHPTGKWRMRAYDLDDIGTYQWSYETNDYVQYSGITGKTIEACLALRLVEDGTGRAWVIRDKDKEPTLEQIF